MSWTPGGGRATRTTRASHARLRATAVLAAAIMPLAGCSAPHLQAQVDDATTLSTCESAYLEASGGTGAVRRTVGASDARPVMMRYLAARASAAEWTTVAVGCNGRFAEGTLRSAQASYAAQGLAARLGLSSPAPSSVDYGDVVGFDIDPDALAALSLAEDRAGFSIEVLAARKVSGATLAMSDNHKTAAERLFTLSGADKDPRLKVYTVDDLIAHPDAIDDPATGIAASTVSVVEMNCAREYVDAITDAVGESDDADSDSTASGATVHASDRTLRWLSRAAASRAWRAFDLGYPAVDAALFV
ncbi:hypothetical protein JS528_11415 [Bifidobacterium sp. MA2]|uniref:ABC transporter substrate-binding protein n=1 Tax=Bifidobacterium santillanense TaxID=2809028 RepID=A0ABS5USK4_9BIFI|nr:hypothetical protein [Bifidobacterium santillanense]MBT1173920.1 hypothetical protein [Bifidobacterium santillanense]